MPSEATSSYDSLRRDAMNPTREQHSLATRPPLMTSRMESQSRIIRLIRKDTLTQYILVDTKTGSAVGRKRTVIDLVPFLEGFFSLPLFPVFLREMGPLGVLGQQPQDEIPGVLRQIPVDPPAA